MKRQDYNYSPRLGQIVGASSKIINLSEDQKLREKRNAYSRSNSFTPSDEFAAFWGKNLEHSWFEKHTGISPMLIFILSCILLIVFLCSNLLFSPGEIFNFFFDENSQDQVTEEKIVQIIERHKSTTPQLSIAN